MSSKLASGKDGPYQEGEGEWILALSSWASTFQRHIWMSRFALLKLSGEAPIPTPAHERSPIG